MTDTLKTSVAIQAIGPRRRRAASGVKWGSPGVYLIALVLITICVTPLLYIIIGGFRTNSQITNDPAAWPDPWQVTNYTDVLASSEFWTAMLNSTISAVGTTLGAVILGVMASYVIARYNFSGKAVMYSVFAAGLMFPVTVAITPLYLLIRNLGLVNSLAGIILPQIAFALPTTIIILVPFLRSGAPRLSPASGRCGGRARRGAWGRRLPRAPRGSDSSGAWWSR